MPATRADAPAWAPALLGAEYEAAAAADPFDGDDHRALVPRAARNRAGRRLRALDSSQIAPAMTLLAAGDALHDESVASLLRSDMACLDLADADVTSLTLQRLAHMCPALRAVDLARCAGVTDAGLAALGARLPRLRLVRLDGCAAITDAGVAALCGQIARPCALSLAWCAALTDASLDAFVAGCPRDEARAQLGISGCVRMTHVGLARAIRALGPALVSLAASYAPQAVDDGVVEALGAHCPHLVRLHLDGAIALSAAALRDVLDRAPALADVSLAHLAPAVVDARAIRALVRAAGPRLRHVDLSHSGALGAGALVSLVRAAPRLRTLACADCTDVGDDLVDAALAACPRLVSLDLCGCPRVTQGAVRAARAARRGSLLITAGQ